MRKAVRIRRIQGLICFQQKIKNINLDGTEKEVYKLE